jgi:AcrR family transcriptional regulator
MPIAATALSKRAARPGPRPTFSRERIVDCALRLMKRDGAAALSFRAVARELGIAVGALSRYFPNLADLKDAVAAKVMSGIRPLDAGTKRELRNQLVRLGLELLAVTRAHPYLVTIHGPASAVVISRMAARNLKAMMCAGVEFDRALAIHSIVTHLAHAWGMQDAIPRSPEMSARIVAVATPEFGDLLPEIASRGLPTSATYRKWFLLCIDGLLP